MLDMEQRVIIQERVKIFFVKNYFTTSLWLGKILTKKYSQKSTPHKKYTES